MPAPATTTKPARKSKPAEVSVASDDIQASPALLPIGTLVMVPFEAERRGLMQVPARLVSHSSSQNLDCTVKILNEDGSAPAHNTNHEYRYADLTVVEPAAESPAPTPLPSVADLLPGTLGILQVPLHQLVRSGCNVRSHYDLAATEELAESLASQGQLENCTGRWNAAGQVEVVAGETRRRAWQLLADAGRADPAQPVLVHVRQLTDGEALAISATENMRRRSMTPLEECEAMQRLQDAGRTVEDLAAMFGYKSLQPVADRILVARNLLTTPRELLDRGELSLAQAFVIARAPGQALQNSMTTAATHHFSPASATELARTLTQGQMLVRAAGFNVEKSGLAVVNDMFDAFEPYFADKGKALEAQVTHANQLAERRRKKGGRAFVAVETGSYSEFQVYSSKVYEYTRENSATAGTVIYVCTATGKITEHRDIALRKTAPAHVNPDGSVEEGKADRKISETAYLDAHHMRARALRSSLLGDTRLTLVLTVHGLIMGGSAGSSAGSAGIRLLADTPSQSTLPEDVKAALNGIADKLHGLANRNYDSDSDVQVGHLVAGVQADDVKLFNLLDSWTDEDLLATLNVLVAAVTYDWVHYNLREVPASPLFTLLADRVGAHAPLTEGFVLTDEWLKKYPRDQLVALAEEAGLGRALVEDCTTQKQMRARIMEHAERLHREGFVPKLVQFSMVQA